MAFKGKKAFSYVLVLISVGIIAYLGYVTFSLKKELSTKSEQFQKTVQLNTALKKKYAEEKAKASSFQKAKLLSDARAREMEDKLAEIENELSRLKSTKGVELQQCRAKNESCSQQVNQYEKEIAGLTGENKELLQAGKELKKELKIKEAEIIKKKENLSELQSELNHTESELARVITHNKRLSTLSQELLLAFDDKGFLSSMLEKEPFTQVKRVELEKMIQDYMDKIEKDTVMNMEK